jgi:hypothetical protein
VVVVNWEQLRLDSDKGPWFEASFTGGNSSCCGLVIREGETIRADGWAGYEHQACVEEKG